MMTEDQQMLHDAAERYLRDNYDFNSRREVVSSSEFMSEPHWTAMASMGWMAMPFTEEQGGLGFGMQECAVVAEQFGRFLVIEPVFDSVVVAGALLSHEGVNTPDAVIEKMATGEIHIILAHAEADAAPSVTNTRALLQPTESGYRLTGEKVFVAGGGSATHFIITACLGEAFAYALVERDARGLTVEAYKTYDGRSGANICFDIHIQASALMASGEVAINAFSRARARAALIASAEALGAMDAALGATVDYTKQRVQFGQPLASFQALQHRMANMLIEVELCRSLVAAACRAHDNSATDEWALILACKVKTANAARHVTQEAIQLHGGIATTDEYIVGHYFKRVAALDSWIVSRDEALETFIAVVDAA